MSLKHQEIVDIYKSYGAKLDEAMVDKAIDFAIRYHGFQMRASGEAYYHHPLIVAKIVAELKLDSESIVTAILHDTIEDTELTLEDIERHFSPSIAKLVDGVTKLTKIEFKEDNVRQAENFRKLLIAISDDIRVLLIKLADRLHNMRTIEFVPKPEKRKRIALETMEIYAPLAERIGMQQIKSELQDIAFSVLNPQARESILNRFEIIESAKENLVTQIIDELLTLLRSRDIEAEMFGRKKTPYSTWLKMQQKNIGLDQLSDIIAFRILVDNIDDCYKVLGVLHTNYQMVPNNFQDFISTPKNNGYRSIHTVIIGPFQQKIEVQIRTKEMHEVAEIGVAAHWCYKQSYYDKLGGRQYTWIRELLAILEHNSSPDEFLQNTKLAMYYDQVFCFTPKGNLIALPKGATTIDFAYMVHSDIGNACIGAKINGRIMPLNTELVNGDQVEIITSPNISVCSSWENFVVTGKARSEIRRIIKSKVHDRYVHLGESIVEKIFMQCDIDPEKSMKSLCSLFQLPKDHLLASIGEGVITKEQILQHFNSRISKLQHNLSIVKLANSNKALDSSGALAIKIKNSEYDGSIIYADCCFPLPDEPIIGLLAEESSLQIHSADCNKYIADDASKSIIEVTWDSKQIESIFISRIAITLTNQPSGLAIISNDIAKAGGNIRHLEIVNRTDDYFDMLFDIEIKSLAQLNDIIKALRRKKVVHSVERVRP
jgi:GTP pyrophosphokinase